MQKIINILKTNREKFLDYQQKTNRNMLLCLFGLEYDKETLKELSRGWQKLIAYFPYEKMANYEINLLANGKPPSYSIAGVTFIEGKMLYFATVRIRMNKVTAKQKNYDHLYFNQKINVFEAEEDFCRFICASDDFSGEGITIDDICDMINECITKSLHHYPEKSSSIVKSSIADSILEINPMFSFADQMTV